MRYKPWKSIKNRHISTENKCVYLNYRPQGNPAAGSHSLREERRRLSFNSSSHDPSSCTAVRQETNSAIAAKTGNMIALEHTICKVKSFSGFLSKTSLQTTKKADQSPLQRVARRGIEPLFKV